MQSPPSNTVIDAPTRLTGATEGHIIVRPGVSLTIAGQHDGSVELESTSELDLRGVVRGRLEIGSLATARISGELVGPLDIRIAGTLIIETSGRFRGPVANFGSFTNLGSRSGHVDGRAPDDRPGSVARG